LLEIVSFCTPQFKTHLTEIVVAHRYGSYMLHKKVNIAQISKALGHSKVSTTLDIYIHEMPEDWADLVLATASMETA
tara:strand:+ start:264 stop:494 length:231 start_codon:yes stop_codon:yes gene_type:complete